MRNLRVSVSELVSRNGIDSVWKIVGDWWPFDSYIAVRNVIVSLRRWSHSTREEQLPYALPFADQMRIVTVTRNFRTLAVYFVFRIASVRCHNDQRKQFMYANQVIRCGRHDLRITWYESRHFIRKGGNFAARPVTQCNGVVLAFFGFMFNFRLKNVLKLWVK